MEALRSRSGSPSGLERAWVQANFLSSPDRATTAAGDPECLSSRSITTSWALVRDLADVIMVGVA
jgi:5-amino-6-(5-phosphoribosylamino)uracil reductase